MTFSKQILLTIIIFFIIISSSGFVIAEQCANSTAELDDFAVCCPEFCDDDSTGCEMVVACDGFTPDFYSLAYATATQNTLDIIDASCGVCSSEYTSGLCNGNNLNYYSCYDLPDCENPDGQTPAPSGGCVFDEMEVTEFWYYCYVDGVPFEDEGVITNCDDSTPPTDDYDVTGTLALVSGEYNLYLEDFEIEFSGNYDNYNIYTTGAFSISGVASGTYTLTFTNAEVIDDVCIGCTSPTETFTVTDENYDLGTITASCQSVAFDQCSGANPPPPPVCNEDDCNPATNSICENGSWVQYDLSLPDNYSYYCAEERCEERDPECTELNCQPSIICDGICPPNCYSPLEDPDCGIGGCNFSSSYHRWCNTTLETWQYYPQNLSQDYYCSVCSQDGFVCQGELCGNGVVDLSEGEQCDYGGGSGIWGPGYGPAFGEDNQSCEYQYCINPYDTLGTGCTCNVIQGECDDGTLNPGEECGEPGYNCLLPGEECDMNTCTCESIDQDCGFTADTTIDTISVSAIPCSTELLITVTIYSDCANYVDQVKLYDCSGDSCFSPPGQTAYVIANGGLDPYAEFTVDVGTNYNYLYNFSASIHFEDYDWSDIAVEKSKTHLSGDEECLTWDNADLSCQDGWCYDAANTLAYCNSTNHFHNDSCDTGEVCGFDINGFAECIEIPFIDDCNFCMGLGGFFYTPDKEFEDEECQDLFYIVDDLPSTCYWDVMYSTANKAFSCFDTSSCYNYHSEFACNNDPCKKGFGVDACQWVPYNIQTGQGVCRPTISELHDCSQSLNFNSNNLFLFTQVFNNINFSASSNRVCSLYGDCFYRAGVDYDRPAMCKNSNEVICEDFLSIENCLGADLTNFELNVSGMLEPLDYSSNIISDEAKCVWDSQDGCIRDANGDGEDDSDEEGPLFDFMDGFDEVDSSDITAQRDFGSPNTTLQDLPSNGLHGNNIMISFGVEDEYTPLDISTFYCLSYRGQNELSSYTTTQYLPDVFDNLILGSGCEFDSGNWQSVDNEEFYLNSHVNNEGYYTAYFFSMDPALNIERVQAVDLQVNSEEPEFTMNYSYVTYPADDYISTLTVNFTVESAYSYPYVDCTGFLYLIGPNNPIAISGDPLIYNVSGIGTEFSAIYTGREDGNYFYNITCTDTLLGNSKSEVHDIIIDGDTRIFEVEPHLETFKSTSIDFSLKTHNDAVCYYMNRNNLGFEGNFDEIYGCAHSTANNNICGTFNKTLLGNGVYLHEKTNIPFIEESNVFVYDVACDISIFNQTTQQYNNILVEGNDLDRIIFAQDYNAPFVNLKVTENNETLPYEDLNPYEWYEHPFVKATCVDDPTFDGGIFLFEGQHDLSFGCSLGNDENLFYCTLPAQNCGNLQSKFNPYQEQFIDPDLNLQNVNNGGHIQYICTYGKDNHSNPNQGDTLCRTIKMDGVDPNITDFRVVKQHNPTENVDFISKAYYDVIIDVDESLSEYSVSFVVDGFINNPVSLNPMYDSETQQVIATLNMHSFPELYGIALDEGVTMDFSVELTDAHERTSELTDYDYLSYPIDTSLPSAPIFEPIFGSYHRDVGKFYDIIGNLYPVIFYENNLVKDHTAYASDEFSLDNAFYSNQEDIFLTGFVIENQPINISLLKCDQSQDLGFYTTIIDNYDQSLFTGINENNDEWEYSFNSYDSTHPANKGENIIHLNTQLTDDQRTAIIGKYAKLPIDSDAYSSDKAYGKETTYSNYFKYYIVDNIALDESTTPAHHYITISPALEEDLLADSEIKFYNSDKENNPDDYFEFNMENNYEFACGQGIGFNLYTLRARSRYPNGLLNDTENINYFIDTAVPELRYVFSAPAGTTIDSTPTLMFNITEDACGSGLVYQNAELILTNLATQDTVTYELDNPISIGTPEKANRIHYAFEKELPTLAQGSYEVTFNIEDYAGNKVILDDEEWVLDINSSGIIKPTINVSESNADYNPWNKIYFVNTTPDNISLLGVDAENVSVKLIPDNIELNCSKNDTLRVVICQFLTDLSGEQLYNIDITALEAQQEIAHWDDIKLEYDITTPNVTGVDLPGSIRSGDKRVFKIFLGQPEKDIVTTIAYLEQNYTLEEMSSNSDKDAYASYLDSTYFGWQEISEPYNFTITVFDRAMNSITINESIFVDDTPPVINITRFESGGVTVPTGGNPYNLLENITTKNTSIFINGTVQDALIKDICLNVTFDGLTVNIDDPCQEVCQPGQYPPGCIEEGTGNFQFSFALTLDSNYHTGAEVWNLINVVATDEAFNQNIETLAALMDWLPPEFINIGFMN